MSSPDISQSNCCQVMDFTSDLLRGQRYQRLYELPEALDFTVFSPFCGIIEPPNEGEKLWQEAARTFSFLN